MDYTLWSKKKFWAVLVGVFFIGAVMTASGQEPSAEPEVVTEQVEVVKEVESTEDLNRLDAIDREIFGLSAEVIDAQSTSLEVAGDVLGNLNTITVADMETATEMINEQRARIDAVTVKMDQKQQEREAVLAK